MKIQKLWSCAIVAGKLLDENVNELSLLIYSHAEYLEDINHTPKSTQGIKKNLF